MEFLAIENLCLVLPGKVLYLPVRAHHIKVSQVCLFFDQSLDQGISGIFRIRPEEGKLLPPEFFSDKFGIRMTVEYKDDVGFFYLLEQGQLPNQPVFALWIGYLQARDMADQVAAVYQVGHFFRSVPSYRNEEKRRKIGMKLKAVCFSRLEDDDLSHIAYPSFKLFRIGFDDGKCAVVNRDDLFGLCELHGFGR